MGYSKLATMHYAYCRRCGHEVTVKVLSDEFRHYQRASEIGHCMHDCESELDIALSKKPPHLWLKDAEKEGLKFEDYSNPRYRKVRSSQ